MQFSIYQESRRGARSSNQDRIAYCYSKDALLMLVADGMGGQRAGDTLMLCSDGLWGPLSSRIIGGAVQGSGIMRAVPELLDEAERRAGRECDNLSAIAVTWE